MLPENSSGAVAGAAFPGGSTGGSGSVARSGRAATRLAAILAICLIVGSAAVGWAREPQGGAREPQGGARERLLPQVAQVYGRATASQPIRRLPIGLFDSGTGGLAVLEQILQHDGFDNTTGAAVAGGDGKPDFADERFQFLADQANMPYGNYPAAGKQSFLVELILHDAAFLLRDQFWRTPRAPVSSRGKRPVKAIVIACNTATAYGRQELERLIHAADIGVPMVNVVDAGACGALDALTDPSRQAVGVLATAGTVASGAYPAAIQRLADQRGWGPVQVIQQGSIGLAGAIDGSREFLAATGDFRPREAYRGPAAANPAAPLDPALLPRYGFDFSGGCMLWEGDPAEPVRLQINSVENYAAYEIVSLLEKARQLPEKLPLAAIVLGCTHFPYCAESFRQELQRLYDYREQGQYIYRDVLAGPDIPLIDPASHVAEQLYATLVSQRKLRRAGGARGGLRGEFYMTVPALHVPIDRLDPQGGFTHDYKYGRQSISDPPDFRAVPLTEALIEPPVARRLEQQLPAVWTLLNEFSSRQGALVPAGR